MKRICSLLALAAIVMASSAPMSQAGGLVQSLPKDGSWTKYYVEMNNDRQAQQNATGTFTLRSVGSVTENDEKCRWIEIEMNVMVNGMKQGGVTKFLIREKDFKAGAKGSPEIIRGWRKDQIRGEIKELSEREKKSNGEAAILLGGKLKDVKSIKVEKVIDYQKGQLKIASGRKGTLDIQGPENPNVKVKSSVIQSIWTHKKIPFGLAAMEIAIKRTINDIPPMTMTMSFTVQDHGTGAKSALPDQK